MTDAGDTPAPTTARIGIRELRNNVAAVVRRAAAGERIVLTVDGVAAAQLGPLDRDAASPLTLDDLVTTGLLQPPASRDYRLRAHLPRPGEMEDVPVDVRLDAVMDELRGAR